MFEKDGREERCAEENKVGQMKIYTCTRHKDKTDHIVGNWPNLDVQKEC